MKLNTTQLNNERYIAALYMRLSKEDADSLESSSISTQRKILNGYVKENGFIIYDEYIDDGFSGTSFDRPEFLRMMNDIELGRINTVITKDLSRLGRNSARTSDLIDEYFPLKKVRYISVHEGIDSFVNTNSCMIAPLTNVVNELYARDISNKIRLAFESKIQDGDFIGSFAPYGYQKDSNNKNHLIVDEVSAVYVRKIFALAQKGDSPSQIARILKNDGVPTPSEYRLIKSNCLKSNNYTNCPNWTSGSVSKILKNIYYLGHTAQGKTTKLSFKSNSSIVNPQSEWVVVYHTHEPIIDEDTWNLVSRFMESRTCKKEIGFYNIFSGLAKCADCKKSMSSVSTRKKGSPANLACGGYKLCGKQKCTNHYIDYNILYQVVKDSLKQQNKLTQQDKNDLLEQMKIEYENKIENHGDNIYQSAFKKLEQVNNKIINLYDDKYNGIIAEEYFKSLFLQYDKEKKELLNKINQFELLNQNEESKNHLKKQNEDFLKLIDDCVEIKELNKELLFHLIDHIEIGQGKYVNTPTGKVKKQNIKIYFRFQCDMSVSDITI